MLTTTASAGKIAASRFETAAVSVVFTQNSTTSAPAAADNSVDTCRMNRVLELDTNR